MHIPSKSSLTQMQPIVKKKVQLQQPVKKYAPEAKHDFQSVSIFSHTNVKPVIPRESYEPISERNSITIVKEVHQYEKQPADFQMKDDVNSDSSTSADTQESVISSIQQAPINSPQVQVTKDDITLNQVGTVPGNAINKIEAFQVVKLPSRLDSLVYTYDYLRMSLRLFVLLTGFYFLVTLMLHAKEDYSRKRMNETLSLQYQIEGCRTQYYQNECQPELRRDGIDQFCLEQELCMHRDPYLEISNLQIMIKLIVELLNTFFTHLTLRSLLFVALLLFGFIFIREVPSAKHTAIQK